MSDRDDGNVCMFERHDPTVFIGGADLYVCQYTAGRFARFCMGIGNGVGPIHIDEKHMATRIPQVFTRS